VKAFTATKHFTIGDLVIAFVTGPEAPARGEVLQMDGKEWQCINFEDGRGYWKVCLWPTEDGVVKAVKEITTRLESMMHRNAAAQTRVKAWLQGRQPKTCTVHGAPLEYDFIAMVRLVLAGEDLAAVYAPCADCVATEKRRVVEERLIRMGCPKNMVHATLDNFVPRTTEEEGFKETIRRFVMRACGFIAFIGLQKGTGKTHNGVGILRGYKAGRLMTQQELLNALRRTYRDDRAENIVDACKATPCLVLDEMGVSTGGRDEFPTIHDILSHRYNHELTTVLIGNFNTKEELFEVVGERMRDRLSECGYAVLRFSGASHRAEKRAEYFKE
jgi:DNA replication protein DnaC